MLRTIRGQRDGDGAAHRSAVGGGDGGADRDAHGGDERGADRDSGGGAARRRADAQGEAKCDTDGRVNGEAGADRARGGRGAVTRRGERGSETAIFRSTKGLGFRWLAPPAAKRADLFRADWQPDWPLSEPKQAVWIHSNIGSMTQHMPLCHFPFI